MSTDVLPAIRRYAIHAKQYLENGLLALQNKEAGKAGELLWGSVAEAFQAVSAYKNIPIHTHRDLKNFALQLGRDLKDPDIEKDFALAESLHHNFYEVQQEPIDVEILVPTVQGLVAKLFGLIPPEVREKLAAS